MLFEIDERRTAAEFFLWATLMKCLIVRFSNICLNNLAAIFVRIVPQSLLVSPMSSFLGTSIDSPQSICWLAFSGRLPTFSRYIIQSTQFSILHAINSALEFNHWKQVFFDVPFYGHDLSNWCSFSSFPSSFLKCFCQRLSCLSWLRTFNLDLFGFFLPRISFTISRATADFLLSAAFLMLSILLWRNKICSFLCFDKNCFRIVKFGYIILRWRWITNLFSILEFHYSLTNQWCISGRMLESFSLGHIVSPTPTTKIYMQLASIWCTKSFLESRI